MKLKNDTEKRRELISLTSKRLIHSRGNKAVFFPFRLSRIKDRRIVENVIGHARIRKKNFKLGVRFISLAGKNRLDHRSISRGIKGS